MWVLKWALVVVGLVGGSALAHHLWGAQGAQEGVSPGSQAIATPQALWPHVLQAAPADHMTSQAQGEVPFDEPPSATSAVSKVRREWQGHLWRRRLP